MNKGILILKALLSIPKTIYFNFKVFNFSTAIKLPILITNNVRIKGIYKGCICIKETKIKPFMIVVGLGGSDAIESNKGIIYIEKKHNAKINFSSSARFSEGCRLYIKEGILNFGKNFRSNKNLFISCDECISFGDDVVLGWNVTLRDSDGHFIIDDGKRKQNLGTIEIGNHNWICSYVTILKNNYTGNDCVVAYNSCMTGNSSTENNCLYAGYPAKVIKKDINWEE